MIDRYGEKFIVLLASIALASVGLLVGLLIAHALS